MALSGDRDTRRREGVYARYPVAGGVKIYRGGMVCLNASGYAVPAADAPDYKFAGIAVDSVDNSSGSDGDVYIRVIRKGTFAVSKDSPALTDIGENAYVVDDETVSTAATTNNILAGIVVDIDISAGEVWVEIG